MNKDKRNNIQLLGTLNNADESGIIANANQIYDDVQQKDQETINSELIAAVGTGGSTDTRITNAVNVEKTRAEGAESTLDGKITAEQTRAVNAENALDGRVDTLEEAVGTGGSVDSRIASAVATESSRAQEAEANRYTKNETYTKEEVNNLITTPNQEYVSVTATKQTIVFTDLLPAPGAADTTYRVGNWDGTQYNDSVFSEYAWNGSAYIKLSTKSQVGEVYDISANHANSKYADLAAALNGGTNIPQSLQRGGMSIKFVQSSDNKYVQYRLMSNSFNTIVTNWQGVDDVAVAGSKNLITSGFVYQYNQSSSLRSGKIEKVLFKNRITGFTLSSGGYKIDNGILNYFESERWKYVIVPINNIARIKTAAGTVSSNIAKIPAIIYLRGEEPTQANFINGYEQYAVRRNEDVGTFNSGLVIPEGATHIIVNLSTSIYSNIELYDDTFFDVDDKPIAGSNNLVKSGGIYDALQNNPRFTLFKKENIAKSPVVASAEQIITGIYLENADGTPVEYTKEINGVTYYLGILSIRQGNPNKDIKRGVSIGYAPMDNNATFDRFVVLGNTETISYVGVEHMIAHDIQGFKTVEIWVDWDKYDETLESGSRHLYELFLTINNGSITTYRYKRDYKYTGIDRIPVENSTNPITSGAVYELSKNLTGEKQIKTTDITTIRNKAVVMQNGVPVVTDTTAAFRYGIIPVAGLKHVITFSGTASYSSKVPAIIFLRTNEITQDSYITGSEKYGTGKTPNPEIIAKFDEDIVIPSEANYAIINCFVNYADDTTVITRDVFYDLSEFDERITELERLEPQQKVLTVKKQPSEGEYGTIAAALAVADSETTIYIHTGIYEENHLDLPRDITIIGIGDVEIRGYLPPSTAIATSTNYSTLECYNGATLENLKITAQNMRYPIHADFSDGNAKWNVKNCIFEHKGNKEINDYWAAQTGNTSGIVSACSAWGGGTRGGDNVYCFNCKFISTGRAFSTHNNAENSYKNYGASHVVLESCEMISKGIDRDGVLVDLLAPLFIQSLNCPINGCDVVVSNCSFNGYIVFQNSGGDGWSNKLKVFNCGKNKIAFSGYGSGPDLIRNGGQITTYQSHYDKYPLISDCCHSFVNRGASAITKGKAVKLTGNGGIALYDNINDEVFGVAMQDISVGETGDVWFDGYLSRIWFDGLRTTNITEDSDIYVCNTGSFAVSGTKIAFKAVDNQNIKLFK